VRNPHQVLFVISNEGENPPGFICHFERRRKPTRFYLSFRTKEKTHKVLFVISNEGENPPGFICHFERSEKSPRENAPFLWDPSARLRSVGMTLGGKGQSPFHGMALARNGTAPPCLLLGEKVSRGFAA